MLDVRPTYSFTILDPQNPEVNKRYLVRRIQTTDFEALKLGKVVGWESLANME